MELGVIEKRASCVAVLVLVLLATSACGGGSSADDLARVAKPLATKSDDALKTELRDADSGSMEALKNSFCTGLELYQGSGSSPSHDDLAGIVGDQTDTDSSESDVQDAASSLQSMLDEVVRSDAANAAVQIGC